MSNYEIMQGDCKELLARVTPGSVRSIVTSPPYYGLRDYGMDGQIGLEQTPGDYIDNLVGVFRAAWDALADDGTLWSEYMGPIEHMPISPEDLVVVSNDQNMCVVRCIINRGGGGIIMASKRNVRRKKCGNKQRHLTLVAAQAACRTLLRRTGSYTQPYKCSFCGYYHHGHRGKL